MAANESGSSSTGLIDLFFMLLIGAVFVGVLLGTRKEEQLELPLDHAGEGPTRATGDIGAPA
jgi:hypothetical protein